jgi:hypothetical protein
MDFDSVDIEKLISEIASRLGVSVGVIASDKEVEAIREHRKKHRDTSSGSCGPEYSA